jgi:hypothetical protein
MEIPAESPRAPDDMHDSPEELDPAHPLGEALQFCREQLGAIHDGAAARIAHTRERRRTLAAWSASAGALAVAISLGALASSAAGKMPAGAARPLAIAQAAAAAASFGLMGVAASGKAKRTSDLARVERCRSAKFRFLLDPALWSRRGREAQDRTEEFRGEAQRIGALGPAGVAEWVSADTIPVVRTIPVGSAIDPHTVHTLMDYYQTRRIDPQLARLAADGKPGSGPFSSVTAGGILAASVAVVLAQGALSAPARPLIGTGLSAGLGVLAGALPFVGAAVVAWTSQGATARERRRARARHRALADLSDRLQKVSGAEAIFRELGFCEDVLEAEGRDRLRAAVEGGG